MEDVENEQSSGLDFTSLQHVFSFLSPNHLAISVKPLGKHFEQYVKRTQGSRSVTVDPSADVPPWALPSLGIVPGRRQVSPGACLPGRGPGSSPREPGRGFPEPCPSSTSVVGLPTVPT